MHFAKWGVSFYVSFFFIFGATDLHDMEAIKQCCNSYDNILKKLKMDLFFQQYISALA